MKAKVWKNCDWKIMRQIGKDRRRAASNQPAVCLVRRHKIQVFSVHQHRNHNRLVCLVRNRQQIRWAVLVRIPAHLVNRRPVLVLKIKRPVYSISQRIHSDNHQRHSINSLPIICSAQNHLEQHQPQQQTLDSLDLVCKYRFFFYSFICILALQ